MTQENTLLDDYSISAIYDLDIKFLGDEKMGFSLSGELKKAPPKGFVEHDQQAQPAPHNWSLRQISDAFSRYLSDTN